MKYNIILGNSLKLTAQSKLFSVSDKFLKARKIVLVFHGIDTFANISFNDHAVGETSNMFVRHIFDVTDFIKVIDRRDRENHTKYNY